MIVCWRRGEGAGGSACVLHAAKSIARAGAGDIFGGVEGVLFGRFGFLSAGKNAYKLLWRVFVGMEGIHGFRG